MNNTMCPRCDTAIKNTLLYKCVRCFTVYCNDCADTGGGRLCPQCGMSQRLLLTPEKPAASLGGGLNELR